MSQQRQGSTLERQRVDIGEPAKYEVVMHNDDFTPMDFVTFILQEFFFKPFEEAERIMLKIHTSGQAVVGVYTYDIAISKKEKAIRLARANEYPLRITVQPQNS